MRWVFTTIYFQEMLAPFKHKVPPPYSRADECARSLTGVGMTKFKGHSKTYNGLKMGCWLRIRVMVNQKILEVDRDPSLHSGC